MLLTHSFSFTFLPSIQAGLGAVQFVAQSWSFLCTFEFLSVNLLQASSVDLLRISPNGLKDLPVRDPQTGLEGQVIAVSTEEPQKSAAPLDKQRKSAEI